MRVKSIVLDGFKSYAHRKELENLSPHFNAITGLNGSGKSNIFDAICFVMGITNLKRVRAEDPRELIFRAGTTGVHAARVTIEFVNDDPATAPPGYSCEEYPIITVGRQIKIGGKQQFFFNNTVSMQSKVKRFFESISLNVDNPHFMVLQGTVHKLIGMRSQDILSLIEEAVGTKAFDHRRRTAEALIRNKEKKIEEIDSNINTQIGPMLEAMRADQEEYKRFLQVSEGLEEKRRFRIAFEYYEKRKELSEQEAVMETKKQDAANAKEQLRRVPEQEDELTRRLIRLQDSLGAPSEATIALHNEESELKKKLARHQSQLETVEKQLKQLEGTLKALQTQKNKQQASQEAFRARREKHNDLLTDIKDEKAKIKHLKEALRLMESGVRAGASGVSLEEERSQLEVKLIQGAAALRRHKEVIAELTAQLQRVHQSRTKQQGQVDQLTKELAAATSLMEKEDTAYQKVAPLEKRANVLTETIAEKKKEYQQRYDLVQRESGSRAYDLDFDRSRAGADVEKKIRGRVGELVTPREAKVAMALMVGAQTMQLRVVVDNDAVADAIIRCGLRQRTAFVALNKLQQPRFIEKQKVAQAQQIASKMGGTVHVARDLVVCEPAMNALADYVYGSFFVCSSLAIAQELAYSPAVKVKAVTYDGEVAEPNGLMTGGSTQQLHDIFGELKAYRERRAPLAALAQEVADMELEYTQLRGELQRHHAVVERYKAAEEQVELLRQRLQLAQGQGAEAVQDTEEKIREERAAMEVTEAAVRQTTERKAQIQQEASVDEGHARKDLQKQLGAAEGRLAKLTREEEAGAAAFEREEADMEQEVTGLHARTKDAEEERTHQQADSARLAELVAATKQEIKDVQQRCKQSEDQRLKLEEEIEEAQEEKSRLLEHKMQLDNVMRNAEVDLREASKAFEACRAFIRDHERRHGWLHQEEEAFGPVDGPYYFEDKKRTQATLQELREAEAHTAVMSKRVSQKSTVLYEDRLKEYNELVQQRAALGEDKEAIHACISGIELRKWTALDRMVGVVSNIFGKLFSTCLPGAAAELVEERDAHQHLCGLAVRVMFNGKPKESLSELSGGQRSLLALCLILAILRVRPAPIYILDEVDAALDPSHTQNIGRMLQLYFPNSQFLLVSLKDGMFSSANVLYHIRNTQGYSEVARIEQQSDVQGGGARGRNGKSSNQAPSARGSRGDADSSVAVV